MVDSSNQPTKVTPRGAAVACEPRTVKSDELFSGGRLVLIDHAGQQYRLLITRNDGLILQK